MKADMLPSQFDALEEPSDAIVVDISPPPCAIVAQILAQLRKPQPTLRAVQPHNMVRRGVRGVKMMRDVAALDSQELFAPKQHPRRR